MVLLLLTHPTLYTSTMVLLLLTHTTLYTFTTILLFLTDPRPEWRVASEDLCCPG